MGSSPTAAAASVRVAVHHRDLQGEPSGYFCTCPRTQKLMRVEECSSCPHVEAIHVAGSGPAWVQCGLGVGAEGSARPVGPGQVAEIMEPDIITVQATTPVEKLMHLLIDENISGVPVVDQAGLPVGAVSKTDVLFELGERSEEPGSGQVIPLAGDARGEGAARGRTAGDLMSHPLLAIGSSAQITEAAALMTSHHVHRLGVLDGRGRLIGIVTMSDIVRWVADR